jgi:predicted ATPase/DNA-binding XRE family transcriptional regulator
MTRIAASNFGKLLRNLRLEAELSQESLAERAGISVDAIGAYERGLRLSPRPDTIASLVVALQLNDEAALRFEVAAQRPRAEPGPKLSESIPWRPTTFIGRLSEVETVRGMLAPRRVVTITGSGGIGKTRVALEVAAHLEQPQRPHISFVDLAPVNEETLISRIAAALGVRHAQQSNLLAALTAAIVSDDLLLILDNCEHVIAAVRDIVSAILSACPKVMLLATSREPLKITGERTFRLSALPVPNALELFFDRAESADQTFQRSPQTIEISAEICSRLDGIPLAIELAAARLPLLGLFGLRARLADDFRIVSGGGLDLPSRQQTLNATIAWSYELLDEQERALFRRLAIFSSGWTFDAAENTCAGDGLDRTDVLEGLLSLVEKSLVGVDVAESAPRYFFFESTRAFALEQLANANESHMLSRRHAQWVASFADRAYEQLAVSQRQRWDAMVAEELDNALAAVEWAFGPDGDIVIAARIVSALQGFWQMPGLTERGAQFVETALRSIDPAVHPVLVARLLLAQFRSLEGSAQIDSMERAVGLLATTAERTMLARCQGYLSYAYAMSGRLAEATQAIDEAVSLLRSAGLQSSALFLGFLCERGVQLGKAGRLDDGKATLAEALAIALTLNDQWYASQAQSLMGLLEFASGNTPGAIALAEAALEMGRNVNNANEVHMLCGLASYQLFSGDIDKACVYATEAVTTIRERIPNSHAMHHALLVLAAVAARRDGAANAARLFGYIGAWYKRADWPGDSVEQAVFSDLEGSLRERLSERDIATFALTGAALTEASAVAFALQPSAKGNS